MVSICLALGVLPWPVVSRHVNNWARKSQCSFFVGRGEKRHLGQKAGHEACFQVRFMWLLDVSDNSWLYQEKKQGNWWGWGVERDNTKAGGRRFPRNGKEVVWRASTLEPAHVQTRSASHESGARLGTRCPSGEGCMQVRGDLGVMIPQWLKTPPSVSPIFLNPLCCDTLSCLLGMAGLPPVGFHSSPLYACR